MSTQENQDGVHMLTAQGQQDLHKRLDDAAQALERGDLDVAQRMYESVLELSPNDPDALHMLGAIFLHKREIEKSTELLERAVAQDNEFAAAYYRLGIAYLESVQADKALNAIQRLLELEPQNVDGYVARGLALAASAQWGESVIAFDQALALCADHVAARYHRGKSKLSLGELEEALRDFERATQLEAENAGAWVHKGHILLKLNRPAEALQSYEKALAVQPDCILYLYCGDACLQLERVADAVERYRRSFSMAPDDVDVLLSLGNAFLRSGQPQEASNAYRRATRVAPQDARAFANLAVALRELNKPTDALEACERALALDPQLVEARMNRAGILLNSARLDDAEEELCRVLLVDPTHADSHWALGCCRLLKGDFENGWPEFEWRLRRATGRRARTFGRPRWTGREDIRGRTILVHAEEGYGDTIQFCRYVPMLAARGVRVVMEVPPALKTLMQTLAGVSQVMAGGQELLPEFDIHCPVMSLPLCFGTTQASIPAGVPYLKADDGRRRQWQKRFGSHDAPRVGLAWSGNPKYSVNESRSIDLAALLAGFPPDVVLCSIQKNVSRADAAVLDAHGVMNFEESLVDFSDTAALISELDLVISVDTAVAHLAGALGKPVWVLQRWMPDWRWMMNREDSPWYPTMTLLRQTIQGEWRHPLMVMRQHLSQMPLRRSSC